MQTTSRVLMWSSPRPASSSQTRLCDCGHMSERNGHLKFKTTLIICRLEPSQIFVRESTQSNNTAAAKQKKESLSSHSVRIQSLLWCIILNKSRSMHDWLALICLQSPPQLPQYNSIPPPPAPAETNTVKTLITSFVYRQPTHGV